MSDQEGNNKLSEDEHFYDFYDFTILSIGEFYFHTGTLSNNVKMVALM